MDSLAVAVIGGGPGGILSAAQFAQLGADVTVYERRTAEEQVAPQLGWTIALGLLAREAMDSAGISPDLGPFARAEGNSVQMGLRQAHHFGKWDKAGKQMLYCEHLTTRSDIVRHLRRQVDLKYSSLVTFADGYVVVGGNICAGELLVQKCSSKAVGSNGTDEDQQRVVVDLVIAADGAGSRARAMMQEQDPSLKVRRKFAEVGTLPFVLPPTDATPIVDLPTPSGKPLHIIPPDHTAPLEGGWVWFGVPPRKHPDNVGRFWFIARGANHGKDMAGSLTALRSWWATEKNEEELVKLLQSNFPQVPDLWLEVCSKAAGTATEETGVRASSFVTCNKIGSGRAVLIGDAAHAVDPNLGAGATNAMVDAMQLARIACTLVRQGEAAVSPAEAKRRLEGLAEAWTKARGADARALSAISESLNDYRYWSSHKSWWRGLKSSAIAIPVAIGFIRSFPGKWILKPPHMSELLVNGGMRPAQVEGALRACFYKMLAAAGVVVAAVAAVAIQGVRLLIMAS